MAHIVKYVKCTSAGSNRERYLLALSALLRRKNPFNLAEADCISVRTRCISSTCAFSTTHVKFNDIIVHI